MSADANGYSNELMASYAASGFTAGPGEKKGGYPFGDHPALLVIDACNAYITEGSPLYGKDRFQTALESCEKTISLCRKKRIPVIFTRVVYHDRGADWGNCTSGCVRATTVDATQYGFNPYVIEDACGDRDECPHKANLFDMKAKCAEVVTSNDLAMLIKDKTFLYSSVWTSIHASLSHPRAS
ncbi:Isochorismatase hydrolase [Mytilinidion resinicola]|uniref:Isochorismatase hydrolase n=1 Tax=Mytilinidion resinicola TaxID=574789 RepID=A0A6A6Z8C4_9PEZI|nr:Isochorismatase hydrolase [Mytilinidion resinicola]KAF2816969.1 Isochorismatase hydrolase [Mytilinidion resinicola]